MFRSTGERGKSSDRSDRRTRLFERADIPRRLMNAGLYCETATASSSSGSIDYHFGTVAGSSQLGVPNLKSANAPKSLTQRPLVSCQQIEPILKQAAHQKLLAHEQLP
jgi:hypothetical protein